MLLRKLLPILLLVGGLGLGHELYALQLPEGEAPDYLDRRLQPRWRTVPLAAVLDDLARELQRPLLRSPGVEDADTRVTFLAHAPHRLSRVFEMLERAYGLRFVAEPLRLRVETLEEERQRRRRPVFLDLRRFGVGQVQKDRPAPVLGLTHPQAGGGFNMLAAGEESAPTRTVTATDLLDRIHLLLHDADARVRRDRLLLEVTPEEEVAVRAELEHAFSLQDSRLRYAASFGLLREGQALPASGLLEREAADELRERLDEREDLVLESVAGQLVHAGEFAAQRYIMDVEVAASGRLDPVVDTLMHGRVIEVRTFPATRSTLLQVRSQWVELLDMAERQIRRRGDGWGEFRRLLEEHEDVPDAAAADLLQRGGDPGELLPMHLPELWSWKPSVELFLKPEQSMLIATPHPRGTAVLIVGEVEE